MDEVTQRTVYLHHVGGDGSLVSRGALIALYSRSARHALSSVAKVVQCDHR